MQRPTFVAWALCACLLTTISPTDIQADSAKKSKNVRRCVNFQQTLGTDEESVDLKLSNRCKFEVVCSLQWRLDCSSDTVQDPTKKARTLENSDSWTVNASASTCESDWEIKDVKWQCVATES